MIVEPGLIADLKAHINIVVASFAKCIHRPGRRGAYEYKHKPRDLSGTTPYQQCNCEGQCADEQPVNRQGIEQNVEVFRLLEMLKERLEAIHVSKTQERLCVL